ncbi:MAG: TolC family protein [Moraxellaceae bacterium]|nr:TolC family protein [Pseudobdellovibrionaceae bacterium]
MKIVISFVWLLTFWVCGQAQAGSVSLQKLISEAMTQSLQLQKTEAAYDEASWKKTETLQGFLPTLTGQVNYLTNKKYMLVDVNLGGSPASIAQVIPTTLYSLNANLSLFDGFASTNRLRSASHNQKSAEYEIEWARFSVERNIILQFYKAVAAKALKDVADQNLKSLNDHFKDAQALKKAGMSTNYDVLRVQVQASEAESEILNAQNNLDAALMKLAEILGQETESRELIGKLPEIGIDIVQKASGLKSDDRADLKALRERRSAADFLDDSTGTYWVPKIAAFGQYQYYNNINDSFSDKDKFREAYLVGLNLTWNLFDLGALAKSKQSSAQYIQVQKSIQITELKAKQELDFWKKRLNYFIAVYQARRADINRSTEAVRLAKEGRRAGVRTNTEQLDAEVDLARVRAHQVNAQIGALEALINLELATGQALYNFN